MIIDDCYVVIGSANIARRSYTTDSELSIAIVDSATRNGVIDGTPATVCGFAKDLRMRLWAEHLGLENSGEIDDPIRGLEKWPACSCDPAKPLNSTQVHHAVCHHVPDRLAPGLGFVRRLMDPEMSFP